MVVEPMQREAAPVASDTAVARATGESGVDRRPFWKTLRRLADSDRTWQIAVFVVFAVGWQVWATVADSLLIPTFTQTIVAMIGLLFNPDLWAALYVSNQAMVIGFALALVIGVPFGLAMGRYRRFGRIATGYVSILLVLPSAAFIPLIVIVFGLELAARVFLITLFGVVIIVVTCRAGARGIDPALIEMARSFGASERQVWREILIPAASPSIAVAARVGLARAIEGMVVVEILLASVGIGGLIGRYRESFDAAEEYGVIMIVILESLLLAMLARRVERRTMSWAPQGGIRRRRVGR
jgi:NitT/TauT family transport system permease protein